MSVTFWLVMVGGAWFVALGMLRIGASAVKDVDRAQSEMFAATRRARRIAAHTAPRRRAGTWTRVSG
jgi:hypothetical protein